MDISILKNIIESLFFLILILLVFVYPVILLNDYLFRSSQMRKIAKKYNLNYSNPKDNWPIYSSSEQRKNIIEGKINAKNILIYDFVKTAVFSSQWFSLTNHTSTIISVNGRKKIELRSFFTGFASIKEIDKFLNYLVKEK